METAIEKMIQQSAEDRDNHRAQMEIQEGRINELCKASRIAREEEMEEEEHKEKVKQRKVRFAPSLDDWTDYDEADKLQSESRPQPLSLGAFLPKERQRRGAPTATEAAAAAAAAAAPPSLISSSTGGSRLLHVQHANRKLPAD